MFATCWQCDYKNGVLTQHNWPKRVASSQIAVQRRSLLFHSWVFASPTGPTHCGGGGPLMSWIGGACSKVLARHPGLEEISEWKGHGLGEAVTSSLCS